MGPAAALHGPRGERGLELGQRSVGGVPVGSVLGEDFVGGIHDLHFGTGKRSAVMDVLAAVGGRPRDLPVFS